MLAKIKCWPICHSLAPPPLPLSRLFCVCLAHCLNYSLKEPSGNSCLCHCLQLLLCLTAVGLNAGVPSNLLIQFVDDNIDQTPQLATTLEAASITASSSSSRSQVTVRMLPGDHVRPLRQAFGDLPPELAQVANQAVTQGSSFLQGLSNMATQAGFAEVRLHSPISYTLYIATSGISAALVDSHLQHAKATDRALYVMSGQFT